MEEIRIDVSRQTAEELALADRQAQLLFKFNHTMPGTEEYRKLMTELFPDMGDGSGADSIKMLRHVIELIGEKGYKVGNIDSTIICQRPKLAPYIENMRRNIANACGTDIDNVSVKATTEEKLGFTGSGEGISAHAVCIVVKK